MVVSWRGEPGPAPATVKPRALRKTWRLLTSSPVSPSSRSRGKAGAAAAPRTAGAGAAAGAGPSRAAMRGRGGGPGALAEEVGLVAGRAGAVGGDGEAAGVEEALEVADVGALDAGLEIAGEGVRGALGAGLVPLLRCFVFVLVVLVLAFVVVRVVVLLPGRLVPRGVRVRGDRGPRAAAGGDRVGDGDGGGVGGVVAGGVAGDGGEGVRAVNDGGGVPGDAVRGGGVLGALVGAVDLELDADEVGVGGGGRGSGGGSGDAGSV